jgi:hypothetical protein
MKKPIKKKVDPDYKGKLTFDQSGIRKLEEELRKFKIYKHKNRADLCEMEILGNVQNIFFYKYMPFGKEMVSVLEEITETIEYKSLINSSDNSSPESDESLYKPLKLFNEIEKYFLNEMVYFYKFLFNQLPQHEFLCLETDYEKELVIKWEKSNSLSQTIDIVTLLGGSISERYFKILSKQKINKEYFIKYFQDSFRNKLKVLLLQTLLTQREENYETGTKLLMKKPKGKKLGEEEYKSYINIIKKIAHNDLWGIGDKKQNIIYLEFELLAPMKNDEIKISNRFYTWAKMNPEIFQKIYKEVETQAIAEILSDRSQDPTKEYRENIKEWINNYPDKSNQIFKEIFKL